jgi:hypothetical protein
VIFSSIKRHQTNAITITFTFSDNFPKQEKGDCSSEIYRVVKKPSFGWYELLPKHGNTRFSRGLSGVRSLGVINLGAALKHILPHAIASGCKISGLEIRIVGRLHLMQRTLFTYQPNVVTTLHNVQTPTQWDIKLCVHDTDRETISTIEFNSTAKSLKLERFPLGNLNPNFVLVYVYDLASMILPGRFMELELIDCFSSDAKELDDQFQELGTGSGSVVLESLVIKGFQIQGNLGWEQFFLSVAKVETLKRCLVRGLQLAPAEPSGDDEENQDGEESEIEAVGDGSMDVELGVQGGETGGNGGGGGSVEAVDNEAGEGDVGAENPGEKMARQSHACRCAHGARQGRRG